MRFILFFCLSACILFSACADSALAGYSESSLRRAAAEGDFSFAGSVTQEFAAAAAGRNHELPLFLALGLPSAAAGDNLQDVQAAAVLLTSAAGLSRDLSGSLAVDASLQRKIPFLNRAAALFRLCSVARGLAGASGQMNLAQREQLASDILFLEGLLDGDNEGFLILSAGGQEFPLASFSRFAAAKRALSEAHLLLAPFPVAGYSAEDEALALRRLALERRYNAAAALFFRIAAKLGYAGKGFSIPAMEDMLPAPIDDLLDDLAGDDGNSGGESYESLVLERNFLSAAGRALLYSDAEPADSAEALECLLRIPALGGGGQAREARYVLKFYIARLYAKMPGRSSDAFAMMESSILDAPNDEDRDYSLWYMLDIARSSEGGNGRLLDLIEERIAEWRSPDEFSDILNRLITDLAAARDADALLRLEAALPEGAPSEIQERISFSLALLSPAGSREERSRLELLADSAASLYYRLRSSELLGREGSLLRWEEDASREGGGTVSAPAELQEQAEALVRACRLWNLPAQAAAFAEDFPFVDLSTAKDEAQMLMEGGHFAEGMRLLSIVFSRTAPEAVRIGNASLETMQMLYPRPWHAEVEAAATSTQGEGDAALGALPESLIFAVIRQESFFDPEAVSHAGAKGLMQLMDLTAGEVAGKLKVTEYNLFSPETSIRFGSFYLSEMRRRLSGESIQAVCAYNAGIGRVRGWLRDFPPELPGKSAAAEECLFVESVPFTETRNYAKRVFTSESVYSALYY